MALGVPAIAQQPTELVSTDQPGSVPGTQKANPSADDTSHIEISPYLWIGGVHGNVGARGETASVHASAGDVLSHLNIGFMGAVEAREKTWR
jgi:hypothetical protein